MSSFNFDLKGFREFIGYNLIVDVSVSQDQTPGAKHPMIVNFLVKNSAIATENEPEIFFEEVRLKVGTPANWHIEKVENLAGGQSFSYQHLCQYDEVTNLQWAADGRVSPASFFHFNRRPSNIGIAMNEKLPINAYFDFLDSIDIHKWLGMLKELTAPGPDSTLAEMKEREESLQAINKEINDISHKIQDFLRLVDYEKRYHDIVVQHKHLVEDYLKKTQEKITELMRVIKDNRIDSFNGTRDKIVAKLTERAADVDNTTTDLAERLGVLKVDVDDDVDEVQVPPPIPLREIDLHEIRPEKEIPMLNDFLKECYENNVRKVRIIHGKGIGVSRKNVRAFLENNKFVKSFYPADRDNGGDGATEVDLIEYSTDK